MQRLVFSTVILLVAFGLPLFAQETPPAMVASYESIADTILAIRRVEADFVRSILSGHRHGAEIFVKRGDYGRAAAEVRLHAPDREVLRRVVRAVREAGERPRLHVEEAHLQPLPDPSRQPRAPSDGQRFARLREPDAP